MASTLCGKNWAARKTITSSREHLHCLFGLGGQVSAIGQSSRAHLWWGRLRRNRLRASRAGGPSARGRVRLHHDQRFHRPRLSPLSFAPSVGAFSGVLLGVSFLLGRRPDFIDLTFIIGPYDTLRLDLRCLLLGIKRKSRVHAYTGGASYWESDKDSECTHRLGGASYWGFANPECTHTRVVPPFGSQRRFRAHTQNI